MLKIGNLFELAEKRLIREKRLGIIPCYTELDVIEYAVQIRKFLDRHRPSEIRKMVKLTMVEKKRYKQILRRKKYLRIGK